MTNVNDLWVTRLYYHLFQKDEWYYRMFHFPSHSNLKVYRNYRQANPRVTLFRCIFFVLLCVCEFCSFLLDACCLRWGTWSLHFYKVLTSLASCDQGCPGHRKYWQNFCRKNTLHTLLVGLEWWLRGYFSMSLYIDTLVFKRSCIIYLQSLVCSGVIRSLI